jgi:hypothetical protein
LCTCTAGSHEQALHDVGQPLMALDLKNAPEAVKQPLCSASRLERAIGVIYRFVHEANESPRLVSDVLHSRQQLCSKLHAGNIFRTAPQCVIFSCAAFC